MLLWSLSSEKIIKFKQRFKPNSLWNSLVSWQPPEYKIPPFYRGSRGGCPLGKDTEEMAAVDEMSQGWEKWQEKQKDAEQKRIKFIQFFLLLEQKPKETWQWCWHVLEISSQEANAEFFPSKANSTEHTACTRLALNRWPSHIFRSSYATHLSCLVWLQGQREHYYCLRKTSSKVTCRAHDLRQRQTYCYNIVLLVHSLHRCCFYNCLC